MLSKLFYPGAIALIGGSENQEKPGGKLLQHLLSGNFPALFPVHPIATTLQGVKAYNNINQLPQIDLGIIAVAAPNVPDMIKELVLNCNCHTFIVISAGFGESGNDDLEQKLQILIKKYSLSLIGPNCLGIVTPLYNGTFGGPRPQLSDDGIILISGSGSTASFMMESATQQNLPFFAVITTGNAMVIGIEEILAYYDQNPPTSNIILLYMESIKNPKKLLKHAASLIQKGFKIAAIKAGISPHGIKAAASHTGAIATPERSVDALFQKAGIIRCYNRQELLTMGILLYNRPPQGDSGGIITHAGGPGVILTDILSQGGVQLPELLTPQQKHLKNILYTGASTGNPVDILATGTTEQLEETIDLMITSNQYDFLAVIFGTPGLRPIFDTYKMLLQKSQNSPIPIYPIFPSPVLAAEEINGFITDGGTPFFDEASFGHAVIQLINTPSGYDQKMVTHHHQTIQYNGFLPTKRAIQLLKQHEIPVVTTAIATTQSEGLMIMEQIGFPLVLKVNGLLHKSESRGVLLNINSEEDFFRGFDQLIPLKGATGVVIQPQKKGIELFAGLHRDPELGMMLLFGLGGIFVEIFNDIQTLLLPAPEDIIESKLKALKGFPLLNGARGAKKVPLKPLVKLLDNLGSMGLTHPEISSCDLNPIIADGADLSVVDFRIEIL